MSSTTIFAPASGAGRAALTVLRLSGPEAGVVLRGVLGGAALPAPRRASLRRLRHPVTAEILDHALLLWLPGPGSYTGEDQAELHLHGGSAVLQGVVEALVHLGARPAEPGEFTRRAFLHGRMDLTAAEGIADLIAAETAAQRRQALAQAGGALARRMEAWSARLVRLLARQESFIEFEDEDLPADLDAQVVRDAAGLRDDLLAELASGRQAERLREGVTIAILGAPNAGKSSLLNALVERDAAIVSPEAGTTRDVVEARLILAGVPVTLADTAGLREAAGAIEAEGIRRALARAETADLRLAVFAADAPPDAATLALLAEQPEGDAQGETLVLANKTDLAPAPPMIGGHAALAVSAHSGAGLEGLRQRLEQAVAAVAVPGGVQAALTRPRHRAALAEAAEWLAALPEAPLPELRAEALRAALRALGRVTGRVGVEQILDAVFSEFCIGK